MSIYLQTMQILNTDQIRQKISRIALEVTERNTKAKDLVIIGVNNNGYNFAQLLKQEFHKISNAEFKLLRLVISPADPMRNKITLDPELDLNDKYVLLVDDVANTGRTLFYGFKPLLEFVPAKIEVAVLIDRTHKSFPVHSDYVGLSLATTLKENIQVNFLGNGEMTVDLQ